MTQKTNSLTPENSNDLPVKCDNRASFEPGKDRPSPVEFYYDGSRIEHRESDDNFQNRESTLISVNTDNHTNHHTPAFSSTLKVSVANKTIQLDPQVIADVTDDNLIEDRRYISYLANDPIGNKESNFSTLRNSQRTLRKYCDDTDMSYDFLRSEAMMEGQKLLMESLRERNSSLEEQFQKMEREKTAIIDLLTNKKNDYERMKEHYNATIFDLDSQVQRLTSEKNRLLERLQLPESERSSLAAEEKEIYELRRKLDDYENRLIDLVGENEELRQEVKDAYLEKAELHDQFRDEETLEFRELQKELEAAAKNYRILQFKLRKAERHNEQLENDRIVYEEKLRHFESCIQSSDDKRRLRKLEEELRSAKEAHQRIQDELGKTEEKRRRAFEDLDRTKNSLNEADSKRLCLQNEVDNMRHEISKLREQLKYENRELIPASKPSSRSSISADNPIINQLTRDLKDSLERENDLKEQLRFAEKECSTMRKKLTDMEGDCEGLNLQLRKLSTARTSRFSRTDPRLSNNVEDGEIGDKESELSGQLEFAEQEIKELKKQLDNVQKENDSLLVAIKYLRGKLEQRDGLRCSTPIGEPRSAREFLSRFPDIPDTSDKEQELRTQLETTKKEFSQLQEKFNHLLADAASKPTTSDVSVLVTLDEEDKNKETEIRAKLETDLIECKAKMEELLKEQDQSNQELSTKIKIIEENQKLIKTLEASTQELDSLRESKKLLEEKLKELSEQVHKTDKQVETNRITPKDVTTNTETVVDSDSDSDSRKKIEELEGKLRQKEAEWAEEKGNIEQEANMGCDIATKINREMSALNESLMDEKLKLLKEKEKLIKDQEVIANERDELSLEVNKLLKEKSQLEKSVSQAKPENDFKSKEEALHKQFQAEREKLEAQIADSDNKIKDLEKKIESLDRKYRKAVAKRDKDEAEKNEAKEEAQSWKEKYEKKLYKETEKRRRSEVFMDENKGNELELLIKLRKELDDKEKANEKLNKKLKKSEETQAKLESELREFKKTNSKSSPNQRSPGDGEDHAIDENGNNLKRKSQTGDADMLWYQEQIKSLQRENEKLIDDSQKTISEIKKLFDEEQKSHGKDREEISKLKKTIEDKQKEIVKCNKDLEDLKDKLRKETTAKVKLENKLKATESSASTDNVSEKRPSTLGTDEKKASDFRSKFEKFGGAARIPRKLSIPSTFEASSTTNSTTTSSSATTSSPSSSSEFLKDVEKQLSDLEAVRSADREELLKKIETQRLAFEKETATLEEKNKELEDRLKEWTKCQQKILEAQLEFEKERNHWSEERSKLQTRLDLAISSSTSTKESHKLSIPKSNIEDKKSSDVKKPSNVDSGSSKSSSETKSSATSRFSRSFLPRP